MEALAPPRLRAVQERIERRGFAAVLAARLAPGVPATLLHYVAAVLGAFTAASAFAAWRRRATLRAAVGA